MPVAQADLTVTGCANHPEDDTSTAGGAIDKTIKMDFTDVAAADTLDILSSAAADTSRSYLVEGKDSAGANVSETLTTNAGDGTTPVLGAQTFERVNELAKTGGAANTGTITIRRSSTGPTVASLLPSASSPSGAEEEDTRKFWLNLTSAVTDSYYEKGFYYQESGTTLTDANIQLSDASDPAGTDLLVGLEGTLDDSNTATNRLTAPGGVSFSDNQIDVAVANSQNHTSGSGQGTWLQNDITAGASAGKFTFNLQETGNTV